MSENKLQKLRLGSAAIRLETLKMMCFATILKSLTGMNGIMWYCPRDIPDRLCMRHWLFTDFLIAAG